MRYAEMGYNLEIDLATGNIERVETYPKLMALHLGGLRACLKIQNQPQITRKVYQNRIKNVVCEQLMALFNAVNWLCMESAECAQIQLNFVTIDFFIDDKPGFM